MTFTDEELDAYLDALSETYITQAERDKAAKAGEAMPDGSYPIRNGGELDKAISAVGRGKPQSTHNAIRRHIIKRAKALGQSEKVPDNWNPNGSLKKPASNSSAEELEAFAVSATAEDADVPAEEDEPEALSADGAPLTPQQIAQLPGRWHAYLFVEGLRTTDDRAADVDSGTWRDLPLPLTWQRRNEPGHMGAETVGAIERIERQQQDGFTLLYAEGTFDLGGEHGQEAARQVQLQGGTRWVSADIEVLECNWCSSETGEPIDGGDFLDLLMSGQSGYEVVTSYRLLAATIVAKPAFPQCVIAPIDVPLPVVAPLGLGAEPEPTPVPMLVASIAIRDTAPPMAWFRQPQLEGPTPLQVTEEGRVYGHLADWRTPHTGYGGRQIYAPRNHSGYRYFLTGELETEDGEKVPVGTLTMGCGHAEQTANPWAARAHYDGGPGAVQAADVACGDDAHGIWVAGALRPGLSPEQVREFRALAPSGDWRKISGHLELVASVQVPVPGFPVPRTTMPALAASGAPLQLIDGACRQHYSRVGESEEMELVALVAAGRVIHDPTGEMFAAILRRLSSIEALLAEAGVAEQAMAALEASLL